MNRKDYQKILQREKLKGSKKPSKKYEVTRQGYG